MPKKAASTASAKAATKASAGITADATQIWKTMCSRPGWWTAERMTNHWAPCFSCDEVQAHLATLAKGHFAEADTTDLSTRYSVTTKSQALPGLEEFLRAALEAATRPLPATPPRQYDVMTGPAYVHRIADSNREGANQHSKYASHGSRC